MLWVWGLANALGTSANVFEVLSDVDAKFAKLIDKECDAVSGEVKKWFKKLAVSAPRSSARAHDVTRASARHGRKRRSCTTRRSRTPTPRSNKPVPFSLSLGQPWCDVLNLGRTGQLYEKKVKKNSYDAVEEHARYIHLLTSIGPEVAQEK